MNPYKYLIFYLISNHILFVLPAHKMNKWMPSFISIFLLAVFFMKVTDSERPNEDPTAYSDDGINNIHTSTPLIRGMLTHQAFTAVKLKYPLL